LLFFFSRRNIVFISLQDFLSGSQTTPKVSFFKKKKTGSEDAVDGRIKTKKERQRVLGGR
jgi:hypothetical protein